MRAPSKNWTHEYYAGMREGYISLMRHCPADYERIQRIVSVWLSNLSRETWSVDVLFLLVLKNVIVSVIS